MPLYLKHADVTIANDNVREVIVERILEELWKF
jgi:hypothetical protein